MVVEGIGGGANGGVVVVQWSDGGRKATEQQVTLF